MKYNSTIGVILGVLALTLGCKKDDDDPTLVDPDREIILGTFDYSDQESNRIPDIIFANSNEGTLLATVETNKVSGIYELKTKGFGNENFKLSYYNASEGEKVLTTISGVPTGINIEEENRMQSYESNITINYAFPGVTDYIAYTNGLVFNGPSNTDDGAGNIRQAFEYNAAESSDKLFLYIRYTNALGERKHAYRWEENYKATAELNLSIADFTEATLIYPVINSDVEEGGLSAISGLLNGRACDLNAYNPNKYLYITTGFDAYRYIYNGGYDDYAFSYKKTVTTNNYPENITINRPNWDFSYIVNNNKLLINTTGNHLFSRIITKINSPVAEVSWSLWIPNNGTNTVSLPELPETLKIVYDSHFNDVTLFDQHYTSMESFKDYSNYATWLRNYYNNDITLDYFGDERLTKYP